MNGREKLVQATLQNPSQVRLSNSDKKVYLFYTLERKGRWICVVVKRLNGDGFVITTYPTDAIKEGVQLWSA